VSDSTSSPTFSVIFPTYNRCEVVERTLRHLREQEYANDRYDVIAVDNSTDGTPAMIERTAAAWSATGGPRLSLLHVPERLPAVKRNIGLRAATGEYVMFVNDDMWFAPDAIREHAATHASWDGPAAVLGWCRQSPEMEQTPFVEFYEPFMYDRLDGFADREVPYEFFWSMNLSLPRLVMLERNLVFHEDWAHIGHEDVELGWRWTRAGLPAVYNPRARADHFHPHTVQSARRLQESVGRGLRDLEVLVDDPALLERYGVLTRRSSTRGKVRGVVREVLFNRWSAPAAANWLEGRTRNTALTRWMYWKVLIQETNAGYRSEPRRRPVPVPTLPAIDAAKPARIAASGSEA
jgi:glycosyltransferase involved in cell wall biosynthesis